MFAILVIMAALLAVLALALAGYGLVRRRTRTRDDLSRAGQYAEPAAGYTPGSAYARTSGDGGGFGAGGWG